MEMTIDDARCCLENGIDVCSASCKYFSEEDPNCKDNVRKIAIDIMHKYQQLQADYKARLRADVAGILEELQQEIDDKAWTREWENLGSDERIVEMESVSKIIQQKIDDLNEDKEC